MTCSVFDFLAVNLLGYLSVSEFRHVLRIWHGWQFYFENLNSEPRTSLHGPEVSYHPRE